MRGSPFILIGKLELVRLVHSDAVVVVGGEPGKEFRPEADLHVLHLDGVVLAHRDDLLAHGDDIPRPIQRGDIAADHLDVILSPPDEMRLDGVPLVPRAVHLPHPADIIGDAVFFPLILRFVQIPFVPDRHGPPLLCFPLYETAAGGLPPLPPFFAGHIGAGGGSGSRRADCRNSS